MMTEQEKTPEREPDVITEETVTFADGEKTNRAQIEAKEEQTEEKEEPKEAAEEKEEELPAAVKRRLTRLERRQKDSQKRIDEATYRMREAERRAEEAEARMREAEEAASKKDPPKLEDFEDENQWLEATLAWRDKKKSAAVKNEPEKKAEEPPEFVQELQRKATEIRELGEEKYKDFADLMEDEELKITPAMVDAMYDTEMPEDIAYYLGKHKRTAEKIAAMGPMKAAREISRIEIKLEEQAKPKPPKVSKAPEPSPDLPGGSAGFDGNIDEYLSSQAAYEAARKAGRIR